jgi:hypothetical protein
MDSSFLFIPTQFHVDIFEELASLLGRRYEPIVLSTTYEELHKITQSGSTKMRKQADVALKLAEKCQQINADRYEGESHDDVIVRTASKTPCYVATNDRALRNRLRSLNVPVIHLRQKSMLALDGALP